MRKHSITHWSASALYATSLLLAGCQQNGGGNPWEGNEQIIGGLVGAGLGGLLGSQFGSGRGQLAATAAGTLAGAYLGSQLAARLTEQDKQQHLAAVEEALNEAPQAEPKVWRNPVSGNAGTVQAGEPFIAPAGAPGAGRTCRALADSFELADGTSEQATRMACLDENGRWTMDT
jgi:surface antigen